MNQTLRDKLNDYGKRRVPLFFLIDFEQEDYALHPLNKIPKDIYFSIDKQKSPIYNKKIPYSSRTVTFKNYQKSFDKVIAQIREGNTYLLNLTFASKLNIDYSLKEIYDYTDAKFKLLYKDKFVCFTPERFINIQNNTIYTYPMKGTIDASIPNAKKRILNNKKEMAEHVMVVDLLRNDISQIAKKVRVEKFRYIDKIKAGDRTLLQVSSKIKGELPDNWQDNLGDNLLKLLPAGSITGAPKKSTTDIIKKIENYQRGFFTGIFGVFDGTDLDSAVMIRFIEKTPSGLVYKSGGGITIDSDCEDEYNELKEKIYVPFF